jgi:hypothetical protein
MTTKIRDLWQSGEIIEIAGRYEVVGTYIIATQSGGDSVTHELHQGGLFPNHDGRAVCWHLTEIINEKSHRGKSFITPWHDFTTTIGF